MKQGWLPPPRPIYVAPSYDPSDSDEITRWKILLDWAHDDDLKNYIANTKMLLWTFGGASAVSGHFDSFPTDSLIAFYFLGPNPTAAQLADFSIKYGGFGYTQPDPGDPGQVVMVEGGSRTVPSVLPAAWVTVWNGLDAVITNNVVPKRAALGPLPANTFLDDSGNLANPIIINYYDDVWIKRIKYPTSILQSAVTQPQWWNLSNVVMEQWASSGDLLGNRSPLSSSDPNGGWYPDGWDFAKGSGAFFDVVHAIVSVILLILSATGVGTAVVAIIGAVAAIVLDFIQAAEDAISGGNPAAALLNVGMAILNLGSAEMGALASSSPSLAKLGKLGISELGSILKQVGTNLNPPEGMNLQDQLNLLQANAPSYGLMTLDHFNALLAIISGDGSVGVPLAQAGWDTSQYASQSDVIGVGKIYEESVPAPAMALWKMGAQLGTLAKAQADQGYQAPISPWARASGIRVKALPMILTPQSDLMNYVRYVLAPRYNIPT